MCEISRKICLPARDHVFIGADVGGIRRAKESFRRIADIADIGRPSACSSSWTVSGAIQEIRSFWIRIVVISGGGSAATELLGPPRVTAPVPPRAGGAS